MHNNTFLGVNLTIVAMLCFVINYSLYKVAESYLTTSQILCLANGFSLLLILPFVLRKRKHYLSTERLPLITLRTLLGMIALFCLTKALETNGLSEVILLSNTAPLFIPFVVWIWEKTKISKRLWLGLILGFMGVAIVLRPTISGISPGLIYGLFSGMSSAVMYVVIRRIAHIPLLKIMFYYFLILTFAFSPSLLLAWPGIPLKIWFYLVSAGVIMVGAQVTLTGGMRFASAHDIAPFIYISVVFAGLIDWIIWHARPDLITLIGMVIVCLGGIITLVRNTRKSK